VLVPLYYLREAGVTAELVVFGISMLPPQLHFRFGQALARAIARSPRRVCLIASGDMSHRLLPGAAAGYDPQGEVFDRLVVESLAAMDTGRILDIPEVLADRAGECGLRPIIILLGVLDDLQVWGHTPEAGGHTASGDVPLSVPRIESKIYSYEGPFGVGYLVAGFKIRGSKL
jgi:AmmeMemoRadiSam system protein B